MKKNISINIGGIIFHIEEDGYAKLKNYLDSVNSYFSTFDDSREIIEDIEGRIAELFLAKLEDGKQVISEVDIDELIATMGTTKDFDATIETEPTMEPQPEKDEEENGEKQEEKQSSYERTKRLYRDEKRKVLGGVAAGIAHYASVDPIWIRLLFLAPIIGVFFEAFFGGLVITYVVLWIATPGSKELEEDKKMKKLFRSEDEKVLGGVASGLATYFGVEVVVVRILFVVSIFFVAGVFLYIILWIITPEAKSITEKMQMQGEPVTLSNIEENLKKTLNVKEGEEHPLTKVLLFPFRLLAVIFKALGQAIGPIMKVAIEILRVGVGIFFVILGFILMFAFTIALAVILGVGGALESWTHFGGFPPSQIVGTFGAAGLVFAYIAAIVPALGLSLSGLSIIRKRRVIKTSFRWGLFGLWLFAVIGVAVSVPSIINNFQSEAVVKEEQTFQVTEATPTLRLNDMDLDAYPSVELKVRGHKEDNYLLEMTTEARGYSRINAKANAAETTYSVRQEGDDFVFDSDLTFDDVPFRFQEMTATFFVPYGKVFRMEYELKEILRNTLWMYDYGAYQLDGNDWMFTKKGELLCVTCQGVDTTQRKPVVDQDGAHSTYEMRDFDEVKLHALMDFEIIQGADYLVEVYGDEAYIKNVSLIQQGDQLEVVHGDKWDWVNEKRSEKNVKVIITMPELEYLEINGACDGELRGFKNEDLFIEMQGASMVWAEVAPQYLDIEMEGSSVLTLVGNSEDLEVDLAGTSQLNASEFNAQDVEVNASFNSKANVYATEKIQVDARGASKVRYQGGAKASVSTSGLSTVETDD